MIEAAQGEAVEPEDLAELIASGRAVLPANRLRRSRKNCAIGERLSVKVNANIGTSGDRCLLDLELEKLRTAEDCGADSVMDLSTGGELRAIRERLIASTRLVFGTVPIYEAAVESARSRGTVLEMTSEDILRAIRSHAESGADFVTVHAGVTRRAVEIFHREGRLCGMVSRGGTILAEWMRHHDCENPLYEHFDEVVDVALEFDVTLSLGDGLRPGALADAFDAAQVEELTTLAELARRARARGAQVMIEGPGHVPLDQVISQVKLAKEICEGAPFYVLGPIVTDVAAGYDHIAGAIGGAVAAMAGADFLCYVTPGEHLRLPTVEDVRKGVIASRIAAHAADVARGLKGARDWDDEVSRLRRARRWEEMISKLLDPEHARELRESGPPVDESTCSMCGEYCVFKLAEKREVIATEASLDPEGLPSDPEVLGTRGGTEGRRH